MASTTPSVFFASLWMIGTLLSFSLMNISARELSATLDTLPILFYRAALGLATLSIICHIRGWRTVQTKRLKDHMVRNSTHFIGQFATFYAIAALPLVEVLAIEFTAPIWTSLLAVILLKEKLGWAKITAMILGMVGALIILQPQFSQMNIAYVVMLGGAMAYALVNIQTKKLAQYDDVFTIIFYMAVIQTLIALPLMIGNWQWPTLSWHTAIWLFIAAVTAISSHYCISKALMLADASLIIPIDFLRLPLIAVVGFLVYDEGLGFYMLIGALLMLTGNLISIYQAKKLENSSSTRD